MKLSMESFKKNFNKNPELSSMALIILGFMLGTKHNACLDIFSDSIFKFFTAHIGKTQQLIFFCNIHSEILAVETEHKSALIEILSLFFTKFISEVFIMH